MKFIVFTELVECTTGLATFATTVANLRRARIGTREHSHSIKARLAIAITRLQISVIALLSIVYDAVKWSMLGGFPNQFRETKACLTTVLEL